MSPFSALEKPFAFDRSWDRLTSLVPTIFQDNRNDDICPEKNRANSSDKAAPTALH